MLNRRISVISAIAPAGFVKSYVTPLCGAVSPNNFGEAIWKSGTATSRHSEKSRNDDGWDF
jgi:hypothetical protein